MANAIVTDRLTKYFGDRRVVNGLSLRVREGSVYALLGRNGAGKSTTIRMLLGLLKPDFGRAELLGEDVAELSSETRSRVAWVGEGHPLYRWMTVKAAINFVKPFYKRWNDEFVEQVLDHFAIPLNKRLSKLSNGQQAQVSLALAVASDPELLILDDPTSGLDAVVRRDFLESMIQIIQRQGRTILFSSHILSDVDRVADHLGILHEGVLRVDCPIDHFREMIRQVVIETVEPLKEPPACPGLVSYRTFDKRTELVIVNYGETQEEYVASLRPLSTDVQELNLEDAFVAYTRGRAGVLPDFRREVAHV